MMMYQRDDELVRINNKNVKDNIKYFIITLVILLTLCSNILIYINIIPKKSVQYHIITIICLVCIQAQLIKCKRLAFPDTATQFHLLHSAHPFLICTCQNEHACVSLSL